MEDANKHLRNYMDVCLLFKMRNIHQEYLWLRLFPFSLTGEATSWLAEFPQGPITSWAELKIAFLERCFPPSRILRLRDEINNFQQLLGEAMHEVWLRFKKKVATFLNHGLSNQVLLQILTPH